MAFSIVALGIMTISIIALSMMTLTLETLSIMKTMTLRITALVKVVLSGTDNSTLLLCRVSL
jgi:hypothetical protein